MNVLIVFQFLLFVSTLLPCYANFVEEECNNFVWDFSLPESLIGEYNNDNWKILFNAHLNNNNIVSNTSFQKEGYSFLTSLSYHDVASKRIPNIVQEIVTSGTMVAMENNCDIPVTLSSVYQTFTDALYFCTRSIGTSQLRFSVMYHVSVVGTAERVCQDKKPLCTSSPSYVFGNGLFMCSEDIENIFRKEIEHIDEIVFQSNEKKHCNNHLGWNLRGNDSCCCGNLPGCCLFAHKFCCWHDFACLCCQHWYCGGLCKPASSCTKDS